MSLVSLLSNKLGFFAIALGIFAVDLNLELGVAAGIFYLLPVLLFRIERVKELFVPVIVCTALIVLGYFLSPGGGEFWKVFLNRFISIFILWIYFFFQVYSKRSHILQANKNLLARIQKAYDKSLEITDIPPLIRNILDDVLSLTKSKLGFYCKIIEANGNNPKIEIEKFNLPKRFYIEEDAERLQPLVGMQLNLQEKDILKETIRYGVTNFQNSVVGGQLPEILTKALPKINSLLILPIFNGKELEGVIGVANRAQGYDETLVDYLRPYLSSSALALESAFLRSHLEKTTNSSVNQWTPEKIIESPRTDISDIVISIDQNGTVEFFNSAAESLFGYESSEVTGRNISMLMPEPFASEHNQYLERYLQTGNSTIIEFGREVPAKKKDGNLISLHLSVMEMKTKNQRRFLGVLKPLPLEEDSPPILNTVQVHLENVIMDRTRELVEANTILSLEIEERKITQEMQRRLMTILEATSDFVAIVDAFGKVQFINKAGRKMIGLEKNVNVNNLEIADFHTKETAKIIMNIAIPRADKNKIWQGETKFLHRDGYEIPTSQVVIAHRGDNSGVDYYSTIARDIRNQKKSEEKLKEEHERVKSLINSLPAHIAVLNQNGRIVLVNDAWSNFGLQNGILDEHLVGLGVDYLDVCDRAGEEGNEAKLGIQGVLNGDLENFSMEYPCDSQNEKRWFLTTVNSIRSSNPGAVISHIDITDRKQGEQALEKSRMEIRRLYSDLESKVDEERRRISREIHDELGQALTAMNMDIGWLQKQIPDENLKVQRELESMSVKIENVVATVRRISSELRPEILDLYGLIDAVKWKLNQVKERSELVVDFYADSECDQADSEIKIILFKVFQEALTNIIRHSEANRIKVWLKKQSEKINLILEDNGIGISNDHCNKKTLGVISMRERVEACNGVFEINNKNENGSGVKVSVLVPLRGNSNDDKKGN